LRDCVSGRELCERDFDSDVDIAGRLDAHPVVPERLRTDVPHRFADRSH
jgi:phosphosulfolactate phosphohydrolase-like enzyme